MEQDILQVAVFNSSYSNNLEIKEVKILGTVKSIPPFAFYGCFNLERIDLTDALSLTTIGKSAFESTGIKKIVFPDSLKTIGEKAFAGCRNLRRVCFSNSSKIRTINHGAFYACTNLEVLVMPKGGLAIYNKVFNFTKNYKIETLITFLTTGVLRGLDKVYTGSKIYQRRMKKGRKIPAKTSSNDAKNRHYSWYNSKK